MVGDGSYLMMNSEIATSVAMGLKLTIVLLDNRGFGCINRLQGACGGESFNNLLDDRAPDIDFAAHARALGAHAQKVSNIRELEEALARIAHDRSHRRARHRHRPAAEHCGGRRVVGRARSPKSPAVRT